MTRRPPCQAVRVAREFGPKTVIIARARYVGETHACWPPGADRWWARSSRHRSTIIERVHEGSTAATPEPRRPRRPPRHRRPAAAGLEVESAVVPEEAWIAAGPWSSRPAPPQRIPRWWRSTRDGAIPVHPSPDDVLQAGDVLSLVGTDAQLAAPAA